MNAKQFFTYFVWVLICVSAAAQSPYVINNDLQVTGTVDVEGNVMTLGSLTASPSIPSLSMSVNDSSVFVDQNSKFNNFYWRQLNSDGTAFRDVMRLSGSSSIYHTLAIPGPNPGVTSERLLLTAGGVSAPSEIPGTLTVKGISFRSLGDTNTLPNQLLDEDSSIVTRILGDARYIKRADSTMLFGAGSSAPVEGSIALGVNSIASGTSTVPSLAIGTGALAYTSSDTGIYGIKHGGIAIGNSAKTGNVAGSTGGGIAIGSLSYSGNGGIGIGRGAISVGVASIALGEDTKTYGDAGIVIGNNNVAGGLGTALFGQYLASNGWRTSVLGYKNLVPAGEISNVRDAEGYAFIIGNGSDSPSAYSNAFTIKWSGDGWIQGHFTTAKGLTVAEGVQIGGDASVGGEIEGGKARFSDTVRIEPRGGLSMGEFTHDPEAP